MIRKIAVLSCALALAALSATAMDMKTALKQADQIGFMVGTAWSCGAEMNDIDRLDKFARATFARQAEPGGLAHTEMMSAYRWALAAARDEKNEPAVCSKAAEVLKAALKLADERMAEWKAVR